MMKFLMHCFFFIANSKLNSSNKSSEASTPQIFEKLNRPIEDGDTLTVSKLGRAAIKGECAVAMS